MTINGITIRHNDETDQTIYIEDKGLVDDYTLDCTDRGYDWAILRLPEAKDYLDSRLSIRDFKRVFNGYGGNWELDEQPS